MALSKFNKDFINMTLGTLGGDLAINDFKKTIEVPVYPTADDIPEGREVVQAKPAKPAVPLTKSELAVAGIVWFVAWLILMGSTDMGGWAAAAVAMFPSAIAAKWWRQLLTVAFVGGILWLWIRHAK